MQQRGTLNASLISSSESVSFIFRAIIVRNSAEHQRLDQNILVLAHTREINGAVVISVDLVDHILKLRFGRILAKRSHDSSQLLGSDLSCSYTHQLRVFKLSARCVILSSPIKRRISKTGSHLVG